MSLHELGRRQSQPLAQADVLVAVWRTVSLHIPSEIIARLTCVEDLQEAHGCVADVFDIVAYRELVDSPIRY